MAEDILAGTLEHEVLRDEVIQAIGNNLDSTLQYSKS
jgi:hypothetical protein